MERQPESTPIIENSVDGEVRESGGKQDGDTAVNDED